MFDVGFWELVLVGVVALIVVGPERLPDLARTAGRWVGAARRMAATFRADLEREIRAEELKKILEKQAEFRGAFDIVEETKQDLKSAVDQLNSPLDTPAPAPTTDQPTATPAAMAPPTAAGAEPPTARPAPPDAAAGPKA